MFPKPKPRAETPSEVIVTTESRTAATTSVRGGADAVAPLVPVAVVTAAPPPAPEVGDAPTPSGPVTSAAVPPAASTADRTAATTIEAVPRREDDPAEPVVAGRGAGASGIVEACSRGVELGGVSGVRGGGVAPLAWSNIGSSDRAGSPGLVR